MNENKDDFWSSKTCIKATDKKKGLEASHMVSYRVARAGKPHTIVEDLIIPAAMDMAGIMLGEKAPKTIQTMPSNNTVSQRISDMAGDVLKQLLLRIQASEFYVLELDESTDVAGLAQLLVYVRYIYGQLRKTFSSANHWKPGQQERLFIKYWTAL